jgi:hypothetical protein
MPLKLVIDTKTVSIYPIQRLLQIIVIVGAMGKWEFCFTTPSTGSTIRIFSSLAPGSCTVS